MLKGQNQDFHQRGTLNVGLDMYLKFICVDCLEVVWNWCAQLYIAGTLNLCVSLSEGFI